MTALEVFARLETFGDDQLAGIDYLLRVFPDLDEPDKNTIYETLLSLRDEMTNEARGKLALLAFKCDAGREAMVRNLEQAASKLTKGHLGKNFIGE